MTIKKALNCAAFCLIYVSFNSIALADIGGVELGFAAWNHEPGGTVRYQGTDANAETGFQLTDKTEGFFWFALEHPVPALPNIKIAFTKLGNNGSGVLSSGFTFGGTTFNTNENITTTLDLDQTDITLYYNLVNTTARLDLGLTLKYVNGTASVLSLTTSQTEKVNFTGVLPLVYANLEFKMPFTGLSLGVNGNVISYNGHRFSDVQVKLAYKSKSNLGIEGGYRRIQLRLNDFDGVSSDLNFSGPYIGVYFSF